MKQKMMMIVLLLLSLLAATTLVGAQTGGGFDLSWATIDAGGGSSSGGSFDVQGTIGQPDAGALAAGNFRLGGGFWECQQPDAVTLPTIAVAGDHIELGWTSSVPTANVYRATNDPYFTPTTFYYGFVSSGWSDFQAANDPANNYTYIIRAYTSCGESVDSQRVGEFDFEIVPGS
ncbi:MAG: hypothetical protein AAF614_21290 [Chloroflexota bacterium]